MALIPPFFLDCVVAIGVDNAGGERAWVASGFLYGHHVEDKESNKEGYQVYLATSRHVLEGRSKAYLRFNPSGGEPAREYEVILLDTDGARLWFPNPDPDIDVAVVPILFDRLREEGIQAGFFSSDKHVATIDKVKEMGITEGDFAYVLGFPMGLVGGERNAVIVRSGSIARIRDVLENRSREFLLDAFVFPGNSGGPVVSKPEVLSIAGTGSQDRAYLIGIVSSYIAYRERAVSEQTGVLRLLLEENSGLAAAYLVDSIEGGIEQHLKAVAGTGESK